MDKIGEAIGNFFSKVADKHGVEAAVAVSGTMLFLFILLGILIIIALEKIAPWLILLIPGAVLYYVGYVIITTLFDKDLDKK